jgi:hypothetical protein
MDASDYEARCDRYKKLLTAARDVIRKLEWEAEMDRTTIDDLQQQLAFVRANPPRTAPRLTDGPMPFHAGGAAPNPAYRPPGWQFCGPSMPDGTFASNL